MNASERLFARATELLPGGVNSPVRAFRSVGGAPPFINAAHGCRLYDVDGREYLDYIGSWGAMIAGHAAPEVIAAVSDALHRGTSFGTPTPLEVALAEEIVARVVSVQKVRMVNSGTEAVMSAIRLARVATGRDKIIKFAGGYHGHADAVLVKAGSGSATLGLPDSLGVPRKAAENTLVAPYNDLESVQKLLERDGPDVAAILVEPVAGNMGVVPPRPGFLAGLRDLTAHVGALLIFDEVMTGFRVAPGGAQALYDICPDLSVFGKIVGGGLPVGAYGGPAKLMDLIAPAGPVYQAGTLAGNPLAMTAGLATLRLLTDSAYQQLERIAARLERGLNDALHETGTRGVVQRVGSMLTLFFGVERVDNFEDAARADHRQFADFFHAMLARGVHLPPSGYEAWFVSLAHDEPAIETTLRAAREALRTGGRSAGGRSSR